MDYIASLAFPSVGKNGTGESKNKESPTESIEEFGGITDMTFHFQDYIDNESLNETYTLKETETGGGGDDGSKNRESLESNLLGSLSLDDPDRGDGDHEKEKEDVNNESMEIIREMSEILNTKLSEETLKMCTQLIDEGADYVALAQIMKTWRLKKAPKPTRKLGHFFDPIKDPAKEKKEWVW